MCFCSATKEEAWHNERGSKEVERFQALVEMLKTTLEKPQVFRVDETNITVYVVGMVDGGWAGVQTEVAET